MNEALPLWAEVLTAVFAVVGAAFAAIGSFGLVRIPTFFRRIHTSRSRRTNIAANRRAWS